MTTAVSSPPHDAERPSLRTLSPREARSLQRRLAARVIRDDRHDEIHTVAGTDVAYRAGTAFAAVSVLNWPDLAPVEQAVASRSVDFPYIPGLLSFREIPVILRCLCALERLPDVLLCDGQGIAHPLRLGLASHLGLVAGLPTVGVAKKRLTGTHDPLAPERGAVVPLMDKEEIIGVVLRTRQGIKPLYISIGHRVSLQTAIDLALGSCRRYRLPETTRAAHRLATASARDAPPS